MVKINVQALVDFIRVCTVIFDHFIFIIVFIFLHTNSHIAYVLYGWPITQRGVVGAGATLTPSLVHWKRFQNKNMLIYFWLLITSSST